MVRKIGNIGRHDNQGRIRSEFHGAWNSVRFFKIGIFEKILYWTLDRCNEKIFVKNNSVLSIRIIKVVFWFLLNLIFLNFYHFPFEFPLLLQKIMRIQQDVKFLRCKIFGVVRRSRVLKLTELGNEFWCLGNDQKRTIKIWFGTRMELSQKQ